MNFKEAHDKAREVSEKYRLSIERELNEQCVSGEVAALLSFTISKATDDVVYYLRMHELCSQGQFLKALEIILRNKAKATQEQAEIFGQLPEEPPQPGERDDD